MKNSDIRTINYFPGEIYSRMKELESFCKLKKESNPNFKYQIRLGYDDLVLKIKEGSEYWKDANIDSLGKLSDFTIPIYKGVNSWEEKSPPKGRNQKRARSKSNSPSIISKKINLRPEYLTKKTSEEGEALDSLTTTLATVHKV